MRKGLSWVFITGLIRGVWSTPTWCFKKKLWCVCLFGLGEEVPWSPLFRYSSGRSHEPTTAVAQETSQASLFQPLTSTAKAYAIGLLPSSLTFKEDSHTWYIITLIRLSTWPALRYLRTWQPPICHFKNFLRWAPSIDALIALFDVIEIDLTSKPQSLWTCTLAWFWAQSCRCVLFDYGNGFQHWFVMWLDTPQRPLLDIQIIQLSWKTLGRLGLIGSQRSCGFQLFSPRSANWRVHSLDRKWHLLDYWVSEGILPPNILRISGSNKGTQKIQLVKGRIDRNLWLASCIFEPNSFGNARFASWQLPIFSEA